MTAHDISDRPRETGLGLLAPGAAVIVPGATNALVARLIEAAGFHAIYVTGAGVTNSWLGAPDLGLVTATEMAAHVSAIREAVELPLIVDGDTGFGNALNASRTVRLYERAGADAIQIEDQVFPKRCGHFDGKAVIPAAEMVAKIKACVDARARDQFLVIARTDARATEGFGAALARARAYLEAGADLLFVEAPESIDELRAIPAEVPGRHLCNVVHGGKTPMLARAELAEMGYAAVLYANAALQAAMRAMQEVLGHLQREGSLAGAEDQLMGFAERQQAVDFARWTALDERYSSPEPAAAPPRTDTRAVR